MDIGLFHLIPNEIMKHIVYYLSYNSSHDFFTCSRSLSQHYDKIRRELYGQNELILYPWQSNCLDQLITMYNELKKYSYCVEDGRKVFILSFISRIKLINPKERIIIITKNIEGWFDDGLKCGVDLQFIDEPPIDGYPVIKNNTNKKASSFENISNFNSMISYASEQVLPRALLDNADVQNKMFTMLGNIIQGNIPTNPSLDTKDDNVRNEIEELEEYPVLIMSDTDYTNYNEYKLDDNNTFSFLFKGNIRHHLIVYDIDVKFNELFAGIARKSISFTNSYLSSDKIIAKSNSKSKIIDEYIITDDFISSTLDLINLYNLNLNEYIVLTYKDCVKEYATYTKNKNNTNNNKHHITIPNAETISTYNWEKAMNHPLIEELLSLNIVNSTSKEPISDKCKLIINIDVKSDHFYLKEIYFSRNRNIKIIHLCMNYVDLVEKRLEDSYSYESLVYVLPLINLDIQIIHRDDLHFIMGYIDYDMWKNRVSNLEEPINRLTYAQAEMIERSKINMGAHLVKNNKRYYSIF